MVDPKVDADDVCATDLIDPERVARVRGLLLTTQTADDLAQYFRLLGDGTRVRILYALLEAEELCVHDLAATLEMPESRVSHALRLLRTAHVVRNRRDGRLVHYSLDDEHVRELLTTSRAHLHHPE